ncbi:MAG: aldose 1-epimerase family protein [Chitinophagaceae bacterium]|nr:aldose 1-epimerase family protein [Chitinophagaceae bacterium]
MPVISNEILEVNIIKRGAELKSIVSKSTGLEYMWNADPAFWAKTSPVLFPIVGTLKNDTYYYEGKAYKLGRHGFAREKEFTVTAQTAASVTFTLVTDESTLKNYPFHFRFDITYEVINNTLSVTYKVLNTGNTKLLFSVGGHPAFKVPFVEGTEYTDYYLQFEKKETTGRWPISKDGLIETKPVSLLENTDRIPLSKELFLQDALVFKNLKSSKVSLKSSATSHGLLFDYTGFPFLGIWAAKNADFVCIEPWCGIADSVSTDQQLKNKEGINKLDAGDAFERSWSVSLF